jgi:hypothetical protein
VEWDGWEEGLIDTILGPEEHDEDWFKDIEVDRNIFHGLTSPPVPEFSTLSLHNDGPSVLVSAVTRLKSSAKLPFAKEKEKEQMLNTTGDYCGGRGGELGRRLEAWLIVNGVEEGHSVARRWERDHHHEPREVMVE